jgi:SAM-dependent methyltransferase
MCHHTPLLLEIQRSLFEKFHWMNANFTSWEEAVVWLRGQLDQADLVRACFYDDPLRDAAERYYTSTEWQSVRALIAGKLGDALDLGAGRGISSYALARDGWRVSALEPNPSDVVGADAIRALAQFTKLDILVDQNWGESLPYPDATFDLVHGRQVLHHARDLKQLCCESERVLKPGGTFIATREHVISKKEDLPEFLAAHPLHHLYGGEHAYLLDEYLEAIRSSGLELTKVMNPYQSNINLYPETINSFKQSLAHKLHIPAMLISNFMLAILGASNNTPGRLYSFVGRKSG